MAQAPNLPSRTGAAAVAIRRDVWDDWKDATIAWAIKEQVDNCFNKADRDLPNHAVPWNAQHIQLKLDTLNGPGMQPREVLVLADDGRGLTYAEFAEGFYGLGHTSSNRPQDIQDNAISVFGTGSKQGDACLSAGVYYFTTHAQAGYTILARTGKELSLAKDDPDLLIADVCLPNDIRENLKENRSYQCAWQFTRYLSTAYPAEMGNIMDKLNSLTESRFNAPFDDSGDGNGLNRLLMEVEKYLPLGQSGFVRMLMLRPVKVLHVGPGDVGLHYHVTVRTGMTYQMNLVELLERNYLFPPDEQEGVTPEELIEQHEIVQSLQAPEYYTHPTTQQLYSPCITVHGQKVDWGRNPLLCHLGYKRSPAIEIPANTELYGDSNGQPPARIMVQYLGDTKEDRHASPHSGVAVYVGCRRVCDPEFLKGNWAMGGVADELTEFAAGVTDWAVWHSSHSGRKPKNKAGSGGAATTLEARYRDVLTTREYMGMDIYEHATHEQQQLDKLWCGNDSHFITLRGVHLAVVVKPGLLRLTDDKRAFLGNTPHAKNLMHECIRQAVGWMLANPPRDQERRLEQHRVKLAAEADRIAAEKLAREEQAAQKKQQLAQRRQESTVAAVKKRKLVNPSGAYAAAPAAGQRTTDQENSQPNELGEADAYMTDAMADMHQGPPHIKLEEPVDGGGFASPMGPARSAPAAANTARPSGASSKKTAAPPPSKLAPKTVLANLIRQIKSQPSQAVQAVEQLVEALAPDAKNVRLPIKHGAPAWVTKKTK